MNSASTRVIAIEAEAVIKLQELVTMERVRQVGQEQIVNKVFRPELL